VILIFVSHNKEFVWQRRGYHSVESMNHDLIQKWNSVVNKDDTVFHLGDIMLNDTDRGIEILKSLNGNIHLIRGNHDTDKKVDLYLQCANVLDVKYADLFKYNKRKIFYLSHYPTMTGNYDDPKKIWNLSGHIHTEDRFLLKEHLIYNVCVEAHNGFPINIEEIIQDIRKVIYNG